MNAHVRPHRLAAAILLGVLVISPVLLGRPRAPDVTQAVPAPELDRMIAANNLDDALRIVPGDWTASEQLFVFYLEHAFLPSPALSQGPDARTRANRLAEVFFRLVEYDFAKSVVAALDDAEPAKRRALVDTVRDYFVALEQLRASYAPSTAPTGGTRTAAGASTTSERAKLGPQFFDVADRFRALGVRRAELHTLRTMVNVGAGTGPDGLTPTARADRLADELGDDLSLMTKRPFTEASVAMAERLGLPRRQRIMLDDMGRSLANSTEPAKLEQAAKYLERARAIARGLPPLETVNYWLFLSAAPVSARSILPALWSVYHQLKRPADAGPLVAEAIDISRPFGQEAVFTALDAFATRASALNWDAAETVLLAQDAIQAVVAGGDSHERAVTLAWFSRLALTTVTASSRAGSLSGGADGLFPPSYQQLRRLCLASDELQLTADALANEGSVYARYANVAQATDRFTQAVSLAERAGNWLQAAQIANRSIGLTNPTLPMPFRVEFAGRSIEAATKAGDDLELARALRLRSQMGVGASRQSLDDLQRAVAAAERHTTESGDPTEELQCLRLLAGEHKIRGEYEAAIDVYARRTERAKALAREAVAIEAGLHAQTEIAEIYSTKLGELSEARKAADRVRQLVEPDATESARQAQDRRPIAQAYASLAGIYRALGEPVPALEAYGKALTLWKEMKVLPDQRLTLTNRARYLAELGDYEASLRDWDEVLKLLAPTVGNYGGDLVSQKGQWLADVARVQALSGNPEQALLRAREAASELNRQTSDRWVGQETIESVVSILLETNHPEEAIAFCSSYYGKLLNRPLAQPVLEKAFLETSARAHVQMGQADEARSLLLSAVAIDREHPTAEAGGLAGSLLALGNLEIEVGNFAQASEHLTAARAAVTPYDADRIWQIERGLGIALIRAGDASAAEVHYENALTALESVPGRLRLEEFRLRYGFDRSQVYEEHAGLLAARAARSRQRGDAEQAFQAAERKRTQMMWGLLATGWSRMPPEAIPEQVRRSMEMGGRLSAKQGLLREQFAQPSDERNAALIDQLQADVKEIQTEHSHLLTSIAQGQYRYAAPTTLAASLAAPVRAALGSSRVLVEYLVMDDRSYAFVVSQSSITVVPLAVGRRALREQVQRLLLPFEKLRTGEVDLARLTYDTRTAYSLYQAIFAPIQSALGSASAVLIVPDDVLNLLPFDALVERAPRRVTRGPVLHGEFVDEAFLIRRYAIGYLTSSAQLLSSGMAQPAPRATAPKRLFAMANPATGRATPAPAQDDPLRRQLRSARFDTFFAPIPGTEKEVARIARYFDHDTATILTGNKATESAFTAQAGQYDVVHFATHAVASDGQPLYSTLLLAPDGGSGGNDGFLQAYEILRTPLRAQLVVLSGCETALGAEDSGQGLVGLVAAFEQAGAQSVLATLWSIDESTVEVMDAFYRALAQGHSMPAALRQAKLQLLQQQVRIGNVEVSLAHPFFWAPFILVGAPSR